MRKYLKKIMNIGGGGAARFFCRNKIIILMIHGVMDETIPSEWKPLRPQLSPQLFDSYLFVLSKYYNFISLDQAVRMLEGDIPLQPSSIVLTFDDGYRNSLKCALPVLKKYNAPAVIYLVTDHVEKQYPFWFDRIDYALQQISGPFFNVSSQEYRGDFHPNNRQLLKEEYSKLRKTIKDKKLPDLEMLKSFSDVAECIEQETGKSLQDIFQSDLWCGLLTWDEVRSASSVDVTFGSHSCQHLRLGYLDAAAAMKELCLSKNTIEAQTGFSCVHFCYPDGSYSQQVALLAEQAGYRSAVTTEGGFNRVGDDLMTLRRFHVPYFGTVDDLLFRISGLEHFMFRGKKVVIDSCVQLIQKITRRCSLER